MRYTALIFDLFGTLVDNFVDAQYFAFLGLMAEVLGVEADTLIAAWHDPGLVDLRMSGGSPSFTEYVMKPIGERLRVRFTAQQVAAARDIRREYTRLTLAPRPGTLETLARFRAADYRLGLLSDCTWEVPELWQATPFAPLFDAPVFSCLAGMKKPDPRIYHLACDALGAPPARCLFIGDGSSRELTGARQAGLDAVLLCAPHEREIVMARDDPGRWPGPVINAIEELPDLLAAFHDSVR